jgi:hypothetical protein
MRQARDVRLRGFSVSPRTVYVLSIDAFVAAFEVHEKDWDAGRHDVAFMEIRSLPQRCCAQDER